MAKERSDLLQGTLDMLVLKALQLEAMHGWGITERMEQWSEQVLQLGQGTLYPALYRLERQGLIKSDWNVTENSRRARYYSLTSQGRRQLEAELAAMAPHVPRRQSGARRNCAVAGDPVMSRMRWMRSMRWIREGWRRLRSLTRLDALERGLDDEIRFHIERQTEKNLRTGMTPVEARRRAYIQFGGVEGIKESTRDEFRPALVQDSALDLRYAIRCPAAGASLHAGGRFNARAGHRRDDGGFHGRSRGADQAVALSRPRRSGEPEAHVGGTELWPASRDVSFTVAHLLA